MKQFLWIICFLAFLAPLNELNAQQQDENEDFLMEGVVIDDQGSGLPGVTIFIRDKVGVGTISSDDGAFHIRAKRGDMIIFKFIGFEDVEYLVTKEEHDINVQFTKKAQEIDEVVVKGLGTQRKISNVAAITTVDVKDLQTPAASIANLLGGRAAGVISLQASGEPGKNISDFWIRGIGTFGANASALVLIDGLEGDINSLDPADIESFSILKDASATAVYGVRGANGVVLITTKRGQSGKLSVTGRVNFTATQLPRLPNYLGAYDYAKLANEAMFARNSSSIFTDQELDIIGLGLDRDLFPDVSWQKEVLKPTGFRQGYYVSARGGARAARYFISLGFNREDAAYKFNKNSVYAQNAGYNTYNYRLNLDLDLTETTKIYFGTDGFLSVNNTPGVANTDYIWYAQSNLNPLSLPVKYTNGQLPASDIGTLRSPAVMINNMGRKSNQEFQGKFTLSVDQNLSFLLDGLKIKAQGAYDVISWFSENRVLAPALYKAVGRDQKGSLVTVEKAPEENISYSRDQDQYRRYHFESTLNYDKIYGQDHRVSGLVYYYIQDFKRVSESNNNLSAIPKRYQGVSSRLTYGYMDRYMIDFNFGYTGSENFQPGRQYGFFPSVALGWVPSNYNFVKEKLPWISFLKFRGSYGVVGNDRLAGDRRFPYLTLVNMTSVRPFGSQTSYEGVMESVTGADNLEWERAIKSDFGIEANFFDERIELVVDFFKDQRDGIFMQRVQIPAYVGLVTRPYGNVGKMKSWGADGNASYTKRFSDLMSFTVRGNFTYSTNIVQNWEEANPKYPYQELTGLPLNSIRGYQSLGLFKDWDDVENSPSQFGKVMPGDIKYRDVNGDGIINSDDQVPLSQATYPRLMYGFGGEFMYKNFTLGLLFKGTGRTSFFYAGNGIGTGYVPFFSGENGNVLTIVNDPANRWIPKEFAAKNGIDPSLAENPNARFPRLTYGSNENNSQLSDFWQADARYLRLQEVNLSYKWVSDFLRRLKISSIDFQLVMNNLFVMDKVKLFDPELAYKNGEVYPIPRSFIFQMYIHL